MAKYGDCAVQAANEAAISGDPITAWNRAAASLFGESRTAREKGCPKSTFLGLCEAGLVAGVKPGPYTRSIDNKAYGLKAVERLRQNSSLSDDPKRLWAEIMEGITKAENSQMEVVIALWRSSKIV